MKNIMNMETITAQDSTNQGKENQRLNVKFHQIEFIANPVVVQDLLYVPTPTDRVVNVAYTYVGGKHQVRFENHFDGKTIGLYVDGKEMPEFVIPEDCDLSFVGSSLLSVCQSAQEPSTNQVKKPVYNLDSYNSVLEEGGVLDQNTFHMYKEVDGEIQEFKYCHKCSKWHTLDNFYKCKNNHRDGLSWICMSCYKEYYRENSKKKRRTSNPAIKPIEKPQVEQTPIEEPCQIDNIVAMEALLSSMKEEELQRQAADTQRREIEIERQGEVSKKDIEIAELKATIRELKDEIVSKSDPRFALMDNRITIRDLFEAITAKSDGRYTFYAVDSETGLESPIRLVETTQRVSGGYC